MKKLRVLVGMMAVLGGLIVGAVAAPTSVSAVGCIDNFVTNRFVGEFGDGFVVGVQGGIDPPSGTDMNHCTPHLLSPFNNNGVSAWVALVPAYGNEHYRSDSAILQIGIIRCDQGGGNEAACAGSGFKYFYAHGGCNGEKPYPVSLGDADTSSHAYSIYPSGNSYLLRIDAGSTAQRSISKSFNGISCWINGPLRADWKGETWDGADKFSEYDSRLFFTGLKKQETAGGAWTSENAGPSCDTAEDTAAIDNYCNVLDATPDRFEIKSYLQ